MGSDNSRSSAAPKERAGSSDAVTEARTRLVGPQLGGEIANLEARDSPATMKESQAAWLDGDGFAGACRWHGGGLGDSKHLTIHCALDTAVEAANIARKSAATLMRSFFHYITHPLTQKLALDTACR